MLHYEVFSTANSIASSPTSQKHPSVVAGTSNLGREQHWCPWWCLFPATNCSFDQTTVANDDPLRNRLNMIPSADDSPSD